MTANLKISEFSRLGSVSVKTLRYYDEIGLLQPAAVDQWTKYRYYDAAQIMRLRRIMMFKQMGFALAEIGRILDDGLDNDKLLSLVRLRRTDVQQQLGQLEQRLGDLNHWIEQLQQENNMSNYEMQVKEVSPILVAMIRATAPTQADLPAMFNQSFGQTWAHVGQQGAAAGSTSISIYYDEEWTGRDIQVGAAVPLSREIAATDAIAVTSLPAAMMATTTHVGPFRFLSQAFDALAQWLSAEGYKIVGPCREIYLSGNPQGDQSDCVTEVQFPVMKV
ncbi:MAG: MerR family transcriptional regulator [Candidatus Promineifilaceae bacterium]